MRPLFTSFLFCVAPVALATSTLCPEDLSESAPAVWQSIAFEAGHGDSPQATACRELVEREAVRVAARTHRTQPASPRVRESVLWAMAALSGYDGRTTLHRWLREVFGSGPALARVAVAAPVSNDKKPTLAPVIVMPPPPISISAEIPAASSDLRPVRSSPPAARREGPAGGRAAAPAAPVNRRASPVPAATPKAAPAPAPVPKEPPPAGGDATSSRPSAQRIRSGILARFPELAPSEIREELERLSGEDRDYLRAQWDGESEEVLAERMKVTRAVVSTRLARAEQTFNDALSQRTYAKKRYLANRPGRSYDDFVGASTALSVSQQRVLRLLSLGRSNADIRRELELPSDAATRTMVLSVHDAIERQLLPSVGPVASPRTTVAQVYGPFTTP